MTRGRSAGAVLLAALVLVATWGRTWLTGRVDDAVLGSTVVSATGSEVAPGGVALGLAVVAAVVAALVTRPAVRTTALVAGVGAAAAATALAVRVVLAPAATLGPIAAAGVGRTDTLAVDAAPTSWAFAGSGSALVLLVVTVLALVAARRWPDPSARYDRVGTAPSGRRGETVNSDWEALSEGHDPTDVPDERRT